VPAHRTPDVRAGGVSIRAEPSTRDRGFKITFYPGDLAAFDEDPLAAADIPVRTGGPYDRVGLGRSPLQVRPPRAPRLTRHRPGRVRILYVHSPPSSDLDLGTRGPPRDEFPSRASWLRRPREVTSSRTAPIVRHSRPALVNPRLRKRKVSVNLGRAARRLQRER
jgi:hypothetical protein